MDAFRSLAKRNHIFVLSIVSLFALWWWVTQFNVVDDLFLPSPSSFWNAAVNLFGERNFAYDISVSVYRVLVAWLLSFLLSVPVALLMARNKLLNSLIGPYIDFLRYLPVPVLIPLIILFFGIGETAKIALLFIGTFFQLVLLIYDDLVEIPDEYFIIAHSLRFNNFQLQKMKLKAIAPNLWNNCRITMGWCWTYLVIAELVASQAGIGYVIKEAQRFSKTPEIYVGIVVMGIIGFFSDALWKFFYPRVFKYKAV